VIKLISKRITGMIAISVLLSLICLSVSTRKTYALTESNNVALVPDANGWNSHGGYLPTTGFPGGYSPTFTDLSPTSIRDDAADPIVAGGYDTVVLVMIDYFQTNWWSDSTFRNRIENFVSNGGKLIIIDSENTHNDYSQFIYPFTADTPGAMGSWTGDIWIVENNTLSHNDTLSTSYVNTGSICGGYDIGDANVLVTQDPSWCTDMVAKNLNYVVGPVQTYAGYGAGLIIYNGLDIDYMPDDGVIANDDNGRHNLNYIWYLMLKQCFNPDNLPCGVRTSGITVTPMSSTNPVGTTHTVTATVRDDLAVPVAGVTVNFEIYSGPNTGDGGTDVTNAAGEAYFLWSSTTTGIDYINATAQCPFDPTVTMFDDKASKTWIAPTIESCDSVGTKKDSFMPSDIMYANGGGYAPSTTYALYIVNDDTWSDGDPIPARVSGTATSVTSDSSGNIPPTVGWSPSLTPGMYDIVVDTNGNGVYDANIDALDDNDIQVTGGFLVIPEYWLGTILGLVGCFAAFGVFRISKRKHP